MRSGAGSWRGQRNLGLLAVAAMIFLHQRLTVTEIASGVAALAAISVLAVRQARKPLGS